MKITPHLLSRRTFVARSALAAFAAPCLAPSTGTTAEAGKSGAALLRLAVVTGGHPYDVLNFNRLFRTLADVDAYIQHMEDFVTTPEDVRDQYDVVLFYQMLGPINDPAKAALGHLGATKQGLVVLHHTMMAYPQWPAWSDLVGISERSKFGFSGGETVKVQVANRDHPITRGLDSWTMGDETYTLPEPGEGNEILLTVEHPKSMKAIAWTRSYKQSRVFCLQSGHDNNTWANPGFREVLLRGLRWCARRA
jgi:uncharacterized protein